MKILKRIKRIACSPKLRHQASPGTNNLPPILFHSVHGENIRISSDGITARRAESFCKGIAFSNRPIRVNERVCLRFSDISSSWSGALRFGFTANDPATYRHGLPKYACPDLTNKPGHWAKALGERFAQRDTVLIYYVNEEGDVHYSINGEEKGIFFSGVTTSASGLWALVDIYGNSTSIEFVDPRQHINNHRNSEGDRLLTQLSALSVSRESREPLPQVYRNANLNALPFHRTRGCNIRLSNDRCVAERNDSHYCQGYVFTQRPLLLGEKLVLQILQTDELYTGSIAFGLTTCDPASVTGNDLPEDPHQLLDRPEYWVVIKDVANGPQPGDEIAFKITESGEVQLFRSRQPPVTLMHVDSSQKFYGFFDLYGSTIKIKVLGSVIESDNTRNLINPCFEQNAAETRNGNRCSPSYSQPMTSPNSFNVRLPLPPLDITLKQDSIYGSISSSSGSNSGSLNASNECTVCYEQPINSVLYMCGHMCMCYECAVKHWRGPGGGQCPICRAIIRDVIRTYWS